MKTNLNIYLTSLDITDRTIESASRQVANYFKDPRNHIVLGDFCELLKRSGKWNWNDIESRFKETKNELEIVYKNESIKIYTLLSPLEAAFKYASKHSREFLGQLRGRLFEGVLVGLYGGTYKLDHPLRGEQRGWGVAVSIESNLREDIISFEHPSGDASKGRKTMDYVYLKNGNRLFYECKIQPDRFEESEKGYFGVVHDRLKEWEEDYYLCFFAADLFEEIEMELADEDFSFPLQCLGYDNAFEFIKEHQ